MSGLAGLLNVPQSPEQLATWSSIHASHHRDILRVIYQVVKIALPEYQLDPFNPDDLGSWADLHQVMHSQMDEVLGIKGFDLLQPQWDDPSKLQGWIDLHFNEHYQAANILEIG